MSELLKWLPWILVALIPGLLNLFIAFQQLAEDCKFIPFFEPYKTPGVWLWAIVQTMIPCLLFWLMFSLSLKPKIDIEIYGKAVAFGFGFVAFMNSKIDIGLFTPVDIKSIYANFVRLGYNLIAARETARTA